MNAKQRRLRRRVNQRSGLGPKLDRAGALLNELAAEAHDDEEHPMRYFGECVRLACTCTRVASLMLTMDDHVVCVCAAHRGSLCQLKIDIEDIHDSKHKMALRLLELRAPIDVLSDFRDLILPTEVWLRENVPV